MFIKLDPSIGTAVQLFSDNSIIINPRNPDKAKRAFSMLLDRHPHLRPVHQSPVVRRVPVIGTVNQGEVAQ